MTAICPCRAQRPSNHVPRPRTGSVCWSKVLAVLFCLQWSVATAARGPRGGRKVLLQVLAVDTRLKDRFESAEAARAAPVLVAVKTGHFYGGQYHRNVPECTYTDGKPLKCDYKQAFSPMPEADALWYHAPNFCHSRLTRDAPHQLTVLVSMEASTYYTCLDDMNFMDQFDIEMTYRRCSHVQVPYFAENDSEIQNRLFADPEPFAAKLDAIAYVNSNCGALNGRNDIVKQLMDLKQMPVDSWGRCLRNKMAPQHHFDKIALFRKYKFCIAMENSNSMDYVTEKVWHALESGCLPIYLGAPNILDFVPSPESVIDYRKFNSPALLMDYLVKLSQNQTAYEATQKWRYTPLDQLSPGFRKIVLSSGTPFPHTQCKLCRLIMRQRLDPVQLTQTHCLRNSTWLSANATHGSTWGPGSDALLSTPHAHRWSKNGTWDPLHEEPIGKPRRRTPTR